jgi:hypothetical protein
VQKITKVLGALPKSVHSGAKKALAEIWTPRNAAAPWTPCGRSKPPVGAKFPKAVAKITHDREQRLPRRTLDPLAHDG